MTSNERQLLDDVDVWFVFHSPTTPSTKLIDAEQAAKNAGLLALLGEWLGEAEQGIDPEESRSWSETRAALDADRLSARKFFP